MTGITKAMACLLTAIAERTVDGVPPSIDELRVATGVASNSSVHAMLVNLKARGYVTWQKHHARSLTILCGPTETVTLKDMDDEALRHHIAIASGILAHRTGGGQASAVLSRIGDRLAGRPRLT